ncbi:probable E3 ubiquitin-protein ligase makorin-1 isoform X2 [Mercenaria mercenaria]|uniref:probable E3 ubiquitin-protein ligase makorin-1 isoform X2 n=1 Tax=Mercenaria mercenaria TaxID=6596 RepID=UPI00234E5965|nr:probable E3 ubiquitin-protein ligase makorin-1 isoform X2 [Mercenaria mercenaria]
MKAGEIKKNNILHLYFVHGACNKGENCRFSHDRQDRTDNVCKYYLKGCCSFADRCRYDHVKQNVNQTNETKQSKPRVHCLPPLKDNAEPTNGMVSLKKVLHGNANTPKTPKPPEDWVHATEFVPGQPYVCSTIPSSYASAASNGTETNDALLIEESAENPSQLLCPFSTNKECPYGEDCEYVHGDICELCGHAVLLPGDKKQNEEHKKECVQRHERDMELSFAIAQSKDKQCGICMDIVLDKEPKSERRFGIMSDCVHCFCLACIRKWRASKQFDSKTIRSCPECRTQSDFVTPSSYWVENKDEKIKLIEGYKTALSQKPCKYFDEGRGECPFNDSCFYLHLLPDGSKPPPSFRRHRSRRRHNADGELDLETNIFLWDFFEERQGRLDSLLEILEDDFAALLFSLNFSTDSDEDSDDTLEFL